MWELAGLNNLKAVEASIEQLQPYLRYLEGMTITPRRASNQLKINGNAQILSGNYSIGLHVMTKGK